MPQAHHYIHAGGPQYAPPVLRAPSPSSSVDTKYGPDETSLSDTGLEQDAFEQKVEDQLHPQPPPTADPNAWAPRLPRPKTAVEERAIYEWVMRDLRKRVAQLEEDELVEQTMLRGTQIGEEQLPSSNDINAILQSLMGSGSGSRQSTPAQPTIQPDLTYPWGANFGQAAHTELGGTYSTAATMEKRMARTRTLR